MFSVGVIIRGERVSVSSLLFINGLIGIRLIKKRIRRLFLAFL